MKSQTRPIRLGMFTIFLSGAAYLAACCLLPWGTHEVVAQTTGEHVAFPAYAPPTQEVIPETGFNPGDFVETRVARLYYYRDAHRVAEIINRNIRSYNQAAVTQAERRAENSRDTADEARDNRAKAERLAVQAAEQARMAEQKLAAAQETLGETQQLQNTIDADKKRKEEIDRQLQRPDLPEAEKKRLQMEGEELTQRISRQEADLAKFGDVSNLSATVGAMEQSVANLRQTELARQNAWEEAKAAEARARATQFRDEVTAAETDPDTYVPGIIDSIDPVTQVSISVIGEGLIQLRGPIKGINKIRTMINQIDSPVGQIKIGVFTVQVNGEHGDDMEQVVGDAEGYIDLSRFLVNQALELLRRAIQSEAAMIAEQCDMGGHYQVDRDRRYLYNFFGRDFIDELYAMDSEFLNTENKLLSLHSMDTVSLNRALFILALAKNDVRERIVAQFLASAQTELADAEYEFRCSSELKPYQTHQKHPHWSLTHLAGWKQSRDEQAVCQAVHQNAIQRYHFRNFRGFFDVGFSNPDTMNPMQREFIRLAQIFKARLIAEMEWKQRVMERGLIEDRSNDEQEVREVMKHAHNAALNRVGDAFHSLVMAEQDVNDALKRLDEIDEAVARMNSQIAKIKGEYEGLLSIYEELMREDGTSKLDTGKIKDGFTSVLTKYQNAVVGLLSEAWIAEVDRAGDPGVAKNRQVSLGKIKDELSEIAKEFEASSQAMESLADGERQRGELDTMIDLLHGIDESASQVNGIISERRNRWRELRDQMIPLRTLSFDDTAKIAMIRSISYSVLLTLEEDFRGCAMANELKAVFLRVYQATQAEERIESAKYLLKKTRADLDHRKLLDHLIDEQEDRFIELVEGTRSHIAVMDHYLKRLSIALEDDFKVQFYDPAFVRIRDAARSKAVNLSQVERTTILTNNRDFAKVDPQASMEFDLPKRQIAIKEAFDAAKALVEDTGALVNDPTFLAAFQMMGGSQQPATVKNVIPGQSMSTDQQIMGLVPPPQEPGTPGSALQGLVPEPSIYKLETGTGFQIRPVIQPDGDSVVYDFDYMYTTNIREPVRADEKHLGRVKRHFIHTAVQTGNFEVREISRYQVALKVSRTSQGVPLLQGIPVVGAAFRPAPSDESSIQQNLIFGQTNVYPTLFDLMGLRWAQQLVDLNHTSLLEAEHVVRGRQKSIRDYVFGVASQRVDELLDVREKTPRSYRPDFYYPQSSSSPHHPSGYFYPGEAKDITNKNFQRFDRRPPEMQEPRFYPYRHLPVEPERIGRMMAPERIYRSFTPSETILLPTPQAPSEQSEMRSDPVPTPGFHDGAGAFRRSATGTGAIIVRANYEQPARRLATASLRRLPPVE